MYNLKGPTAFVTAVRPFYCNILNYLLKRNVFLLSSYYHIEEIFHFQVCCPFYRYSEGLLEIDI
jgi:hypothetical protein